ncbi:MAG: hypothetical protein RL073_1121 [Actinomycetota bacterium]|jgi:hypothetical protein
MSEQVINVASSLVFIAALSAMIWWLRSRTNHWSSEDGTRCICQMTLALTGTSPKWIEARIAIDTENAVVLCKSRGKRGRALHGSWNVIGVPHTSHVGAADSSFRTYALCRTNNNDVLAMLRIPLHSRSVSVLDALLPR